MALNLAWLERASILFQMEQLEILKRMRCAPGLWQRRYAEPQTEAAVETASVWFTGYPFSHLCEAGESPLAALGNERLLEHLNTLGVRAIHTGPLFRAGGICLSEDGTFKTTPSTDGGFDPIGLDLEPVFGDDQEFRRMVERAEALGIAIIGDTVPGHTGRGPDFELALRGYKDYPGLFVLIEIQPDDWKLLPPIPNARETRPITAEDLHLLNGYLPGALERSLFDPKGTGWEATGEVEGCDGVKRRWVFLHYFKPTQPTLNWIDPGFGAAQIVLAQLGRLLLDWRQDAHPECSPGLGAKMVRLDANPFLGIERKAASPDQDPVAAPLTQSESHPVSEYATNLLAWHARRLGCFSFQELNMGLKVISRFSRLGPDLSYDFISRAAYVHSLLTGNTELLHIAYSLMREHGIRPESLVRALGNHDEITYELVALRELPDQMFEYRGGSYSGPELADRIVGEMEAMALGEAAPYNRRSGNGLCATFASCIAAALGIRDLTQAFAHRAEIQKGHLLLAAYDALQPGVFALSGWDLVGALPLEPDKLNQIPREFLGEPGKEDFRWVNRGAFDLLRTSPNTKTAAGIPQAPCLYGALPDQLRYSDSFASELKRMLDIRARERLYSATLCGVPRISHKAVFAVVNLLPELSRITLTVLNFSRQRVHTEIELTFVPGWMPDVEAKLANGKLTDLLVDDQPTIAEVANRCTRLDLEPWQYRLLEFLPE